MKNVLLITTDQQHYMTLGINNPEISTPNLDRLARMGMSFDRAYCPNPTCTPTRASIITGLYPSAHKAWGLGTKLEEATPTIGDLLIDNGIQTGLFGKAHFQQLGDGDQNGNFRSIESFTKLGDLEFWERYTNRFYGFEDIKLLRNHTNEFLVGQHYALWLNERDPSGDWQQYFMKREDYAQKNEFTTNVIKPNGQMTQGATWKIPKELHYNQFITEQTIEHIEKYVGNNRGFFAWASYPDPHPDYLVPEPYASMYKPEDVKLPMSYYNDEYKPSELTKLTRLENPDFSAYKESPYYIHGCHSHIQNEQSLKVDLCLYYGMVSYIDDQIGILLDYLETNNLLNETLILFTTDHGHYIGQHKLIRKGPFLYEDAIRVPFIAAGGGYKYPVKRTNQLVSLVDIYATVATHFGVTYNHYDVTSLALNDLFEDSLAIAHTAVSCEFRHEINNLHQRVYIEADYKLILTNRASYGEIYNLKTDPIEMNNLWDDVTLRVQLLERMVWQETEKEPLHMPRLSNA